MTDGALRRVGSTFHWTETYVGQRQDGWRGVLFALALVVMATGSAVLITTARDVIG